MSWTAEEALEVGLVKPRSFPLEELHDAVHAFAQKLLSKPPMALRRTKEFFKALSTNKGRRYYLCRRPSGAGLHDG